MDEKQFGFIITDFIQPRDWRFLEINEHVPLTTQGHCPADGVTLKTVCTFVGDGGRMRIRYGCCPSCGYMGYIDRPQKNWVHSFYETTWKATEQRETDDLPYKLHEGIERKDMTMTPLLKRIDIDRKRPILEIGAGFGYRLGNLKKLGFNNLVGIENSLYRAKEIERIGARVISLPFEHPDSLKELRAHAPFSLIFSFHVFEHVYDVAEIMRLSADMQKPGDYMVIAVPNAANEPSMQSLMFLPHLQTYSKDSLERLFNINNYRLVDDSLTNNNEFVMIGRKENAPIQYEIKQRDYVQEATEKFKRGLALNRNYTAPERRFWWFRPLGMDKGGQIRWYKNKFFNVLRTNILYRSIKWKYGTSLPLQSCLVKSLTRRYTTMAESPIEIQFNGNMYLTYK